MQAFLEDEKTVVEIKAKAGEDSRLFAQFKTNCRSLNKQYNVKLINAKSN